MTDLLQAAADHAVGSVLSLLQQYPCHDEDDRVMLDAILADLRRERGRIVEGAVATHPAASPVGGLLDRYDVRNALTNGVALVCRRCNADVDGDCGGYSLAELARLAEQHEAASHEERTDGTDG
jgi:hypothetical protein